MAGTRGFSYQPALDGVRAPAVALVLVFHQGWLDGGYVGVSVFFTVSGYLITSLALVEHDRTGRLDVRAFYARRVRRLFRPYGAALAEVVARHPGRAAVVDLRGWLAQQPEIPDRPDGLHWSPDGATRLANDYLGPVVVAAAVT